MYKNKDYQKTQIMKSMVGLMQQLSKLAQHPDRPNYQGALFTSLPGWCHAPGEHDGMAGSIILEGLLGCAFSHATSDTIPSFGAFDATDILNAYDIYSSEKEQDTVKKSAHGQGTLAKMSGVSISNTFNQRGQLSSGMLAFFADMPRRMSIEGQLSAYLKKLKSLDAPVYEHSIPMAA